MPKYSKSRARSTFEKEFAGILVTIRESHSQRCRLARVREYVLSNAMLMCSAKIEGYLWDFAADWVASVNKAGILTSHLPGSLRAFCYNSESVISAYKTFIAFGSEKELIKKIEASIASPNNVHLFNAQPIPALRVETLLKDRKYPSPDNLRVLFNRFGIAEIFHRLNNSAGKDMELVLQSFNDLRTTLAHQGMPAGINLNDIRNSLNGIKDIVSHLDRVLFSSIGIVGGVRVWTV